MKLSIRAMAVACGALWGGAVLTVGIINLFNRNYGRHFLRGVASVYPGYTGDRSGTQVAIGSAIAAADGAIAGALTALLYNAVRGRGTGPAAAPVVDETKRTIPA